MNCGFTFAFALITTAILSSEASAQLTDLTQTPNTSNTGIKKSLTQQVGAGRGSAVIPDSSIYLIYRDPFRSVARGRQLFQRKFTMAQGLGPRTGDGVGNLDLDGSLGAGLADSCAACHGRPRGSAGHGGDVFTRPDSRDAPHLFGLGLVEMLGDEITTDLRAIRDKAILAASVSGGAVVAQLVSKRISYGTVTAFADGTVDTSAVVGVDPDLRVRPFFHEGSVFSIREFVVGAFDAEMGLEAFDPDLAAASSGQDVVTPSGLLLSGTTDKIGGSIASSATDDPDADGVVNEIDVALVDYMEFYLLNYFKPGVSRQSEVTARGRRLFTEIGCTDCHVPNLRIEFDRRVADVSTVHDPNQGIFNRLFSSATTLFTPINDGTGYPDLKPPLGGSFLVEDIFADFKRHDLGPNFHERNFDGTVQTEFMTEPLWGVGTTAPYGHDGRSVSLREVILRHGGEAQLVRDQFDMLPNTSKIWIEEFLRSLVIFPPADTASNLNKGNPNDPLFPQVGHGSIDLSVLFNDPTEGE